MPLQGNSDMATAVEQAVACIQVRAARMYHATVLQSPRATSRVPQADLPSAALACFCAPDDARHVLLSPGQGLSSKSDDWLSLEKQLGDARLINLPGASVFPIPLCMCFSVCLLCVGRGAR